MTLIRRQSLNVVDAAKAAGVSAVDVWADGEDGAIRVRLSIIYNDLSDQEWWKNKKEKIAGTYLIREGESTSPARLARFGIEPFGMRVVSARPAELLPGQDLRITNKTKALEVVRVEKSLDRYVLWLRNNSIKSVVAYTLSFGNSGVSVNGSGDRPALAAGAITEEIPVGGPNIQKTGVTIAVAVFEGGEFEGEPILAVKFLARAEGIRPQAPRVLRMIGEALGADDAGLRAALDKLEADLWVMPEAVGKQAGLELLKSKFAFFEEATLGRLYEELKGGLYEARNIALAQLGDVKRRLQAAGRPGAENDGKADAELIRRTLIYLQERLHVLSSDSH